MWWMTRDFADFRDAATQSQHVHCARTRGTEVPHCSVKSSLFVHKLSDSRAEQSGYKQAGNLTFPRLGLCVPYLTSTELQHWIQSTLHPWNLSPSVGTSTTSYQQRSNSAARVALSSGIRYSLHNSLAIARHVETLSVLTDESFVNWHL